MSYTPTTWTSGDIVTSAKLNKIENGIVEASNSGGCEVYEGVFTEIEAPDDGGNLTPKSGETRTSSYSGFVFPITYGQAFQKMNEGTIIILKGTTNAEGPTFTVIKPLPSIVKITSNNTNVYMLFSPFGGDSSSTSGYGLAFAEGLADTYIGDYFDESILNSSNDGGDDSGNQEVK